MTRYRSQRIAYLIALATFLVAVGLAVWFRSANPYGVWLYTPKNWCSWHPTNSFTLAYGVMTSLATVILGLLTFVFWAASRLSRSPAAAAALRAKASVAVWSVLFAAVLSMVTPITEAWLPNAQDPRCAAHVP